MYFFELVLSSLITTWFTTLGSKLTWLFPKIKATLKRWRFAIVENVPPARKAISEEESKNVYVLPWLLPHCQPASSEPLHSQKHPQDLASVKSPLTSSALKGSLKEKLILSVSTFPPPFYSSTDSNLLWLPSLHWNNWSESKRQRKGLDG